jgi:hypothetical protein
MAGAATGKGAATGTVEASSALCVAVTSLALHGICVGSKEEWESHRHSAMQIDT